MHLPERWGMLQFATGAVNATAPIINTEWPLRAMASAVYYAAHSFANAHNGSYVGADAPGALLPYTQTPWALDGTCASAPLLTVQNGTAFVAWIVAADGSMASSVTNDRYTRVWHGRENVATGPRSGREGRAGANI